MMSASGDGASPWTEDDLLETLQGLAAEESTAPAIVPALPIEPVHRGDVPGVVARLLGSARESVQVIGDPVAVCGEGAYDILESLLQRGVDCRAVYPRDALTGDEVLARVDRMTILGQQSGVLPSVQAELALIDRRRAILPALGDETGSSDGAGVVVVHGTTLLEALGAMFDVLWQRALPVTAGAPEAAPRGRGPSEEQARQILAMMLSGLTDAAMARRLGLSSRTLQRRITSLMDDMGVRSRFQLGIQAALSAGGSRSAGTQTEPADDRNR
jgi:DNA-binding CsgD family transcriptional regulator